MPIMEGTKFLEEANKGNGAKFPRWIRPYVTWVLPIVIIAIFLIGIATYPFADDFTIFNWIKGLF